MIHPEPDPIDRAIDPETQGGRRPPAGTKSAAAPRPVALWLLAAGGLIVGAPSLLLMVALSMDLAGGGAPPLVRNPAWQLMLPLMWAFAISTSAVGVVALRAIRARGRA